MSDWAIVVAAGQGARLGEEGMPKAFRPLGGLPMHLHSVRALQATPRIAGIVLVVPPHLQEYAIEHTMGEASHAVIEITPGGESRRDSVRAGLDAVPQECERVVVHDAARPLVTPALFEAALAALAGADGAVCAVPLADTVKRARDSVVEATVPRAGLWRAQTPQAFRAAVLRRAHERALAEGLDATDDAALVEHAGGRVVLVPGDERNIKITTPAELELAEALLARAER
ncbi:MAG: 2-C-methyl-D-erythritol 4-phosphate cytidylyltransferase [Actinomycetota bacterium]